MKKTALILLPVLLFLHSCTKNDVIPTSGTVTIDNTLGFDQTNQAYFAFGFLFSKAELVSTLDNPPPDITVDSDGTNLFLQTNNLKNSYCLNGNYDDEASAKEAFYKLTTVNVTQWLGLASPLKENQIWIYRSGKECYAKIRIIDIVSEERENRDYAECTFEWVYQPDGSLTFPGK